MPNAHTPGPWRVKDVWPPGWRIAATVGNDEEDVAQITTLANAHLIAQAPRMLAFSERMLELGGEVRDFADELRAILRAVKGE